MKKKLLALFLTIVMVLTMIPTIALAAPNDIPDGIEGELSLKKMVVDGETKVGIAEWVINNYNGDPLELLEDITFFLYHSNEDGDELDWAASGIIDTQSMITFAPEVEPGWYLVREALGETAAEYFVQAGDLLIYFDGNTVSKQNQEFAEGTTFTVEQFFGSDVSRPVQVIYESGFHLRSTPWLDAPGAPNGGGALTTSKFTTTADDGTEYISFCADIGAVGVKGTYLVDETNHGFSDEEMHILTAAMDYMYSEVGLEEYEAIALTQLIVWNLILQYDDGPSISDKWIRRIVDDNIIYYTDEFGEIVKVEGYNNTNGSNPWYTAEYKALVDDIIANPDAYVEIYEAKVTAAEPGTYVSGVVFLVGDQGALNIYQQRQLLLLFDEFVTFDNEPDSGRLQGELSLKKMVVNGESKVGIVEWILDNYEGDPIELLDDITFELYHSNEDGDELVLAASGVIDTQSMIAFSPEVSPGWYLVREILGDIASGVFAQADDLLIYFDGNTVSKQNQEFAEGTTFTVEQFFGSDVSRPVQVIYESGFQLRTAPWLDDPGAPNGGGALTTSKFITTADDGTEFISFCADIGAVGVKGTYLIDETNHGFSDEEMHILTAAMDYMYSEVGLEEYEAIALAQLIVWNMIIQYDDGPSVSDKWIRRIVDDNIIYYTDECGEIVKVEGYNNTNGSNPWYTDEYKALVDDIIANPDMYVEIYDAKVAAAEPGTYVSGVVFLVGDQGVLNIYQQRQVLLLLGEPVTFDNEPDSGRLQGELSLKKMVADGESKVGIVEWILDNYEGDPIELIDDITFVLYDSNEDGDELDWAASGVLDVGGMIAFSPEVKPGWYLVREILGDTAAEVFLQADDLLIYFDGDNAEDENGESSFYNRPGKAEGKGAIAVNADMVTYEDEREWVANKKTICDTLVPYVGKTDANKGGGYNEYGDYMDKSGATAIAIQADGENDRVFDISESGHDNPKFQEESDKIGLTYTVEVVDGNVVVTFDENFVWVDIAYGLYKSISDIKWAPGQYNISKGHVKNDTGVIKMPIPEDAGDVIYLALHIQEIIFNDGTGEWRVTGQKEVTYDGTLALTITGPDGYSYVNDFFNGTDSIAELKPGEYTITLSGDGIDAVSKVVNVVEAKTLNIDFGKIIVV